MAGFNWHTDSMEEKLSGYGSSLAESLYLKEETRNSQFQTSSPVSVLESSSTTSSSSSCSGEKVIPRGSQRARSKRPRPATFNPRPVISLTSPTSSFSGTLQPFGTSSFSGTLQPFGFGSGSGMPSESDNFAESVGELILNPKPEAAARMKELLKKKKKKLKIPASPLGASPMDNIKENATVAQTQAQAVRKCLHCEITKTPQWRAGPMGPKTLCNACGVRYKSGRLFPEYRPAASPTFVPSLHSNSHKKVIEMRNKEVCNSQPAAAEAESSHRCVVAAAEGESSHRCVVAAAEAESIHRCVVAAADSNPSSSSFVRCM